MGEIKKTITNAGIANFDHLIDDLITKNVINFDQGSMMLDKAEKDTKIKIWESFSKCYTLTAKAKLEGVKKYLGDIL